MVVVDLSAIRKITGGGEVHRAGQKSLNTDFVMISNCRKCRFHLYAPRPFSFQDLHEHPLGASRLSFLLALLRGLDARETPSLSTSEYL
jgi:hypothetical protein